MARPRRCIPCAGLVCVRPAERLPTHTTTSAATGLPSPHPISAVHLHHRLERQQEQHCGGSTGCLPRLPRRPAGPAPAGVRPPGQPHQVCHPRALPPGERHACMHAGSSRARAAPTPHWTAAMLPPRAHLHAAALPAGGVRAALQHPPCGGAVQPERGRLAAPASGAGMANRAACGAAPHPLSTALHVLLRLPIPPACASVLVVPGAREPGSAPHSAQVGGSGGIQGIWLRTTPSEGGTAPTDAAQAGLQAQWRQLSNVNGTAAWQLRWAVCTCACLCRCAGAHRMPWPRSSLWVQHHSLSPHLSACPPACSGVPKPPLDLLIYPDLGPPLLAT